jgi:hypothetical protein
MEEGTQFKGWLAVNEVTTWIMSKEELAAKYGRDPVKKRPGKKPGNWSWSKISHEEYAALKKSGASDEEILSTRPYLSLEKLSKLKNQWGLKE